MTTSDLQSFLASGAFIRMSETRWCLGWGAIKPMAEPDLHASCFYISDFFAENSSWIEFEFNKELSTAELQKILELNPGAPMRSMKEVAELAKLGEMGSLFESTSWQWQEADRAQFEESFVGIKKKIATAELKKCVPLTWESSTQTPGEKELKLILHRLLSAPENSIPFGYWHDGRGLVGATPEKLFSLHGSQLTTMALAGTKKSTSDDNLLENSKEVEEHNFVVAQINSVLKKWGHIKESATVEEDFGSLSHLKTKIECEVTDSLSVNAMIEQLHPTPALGGEPKKLAVELLKIQVGADARSFYGAPFGFKSKQGSVEVLVAIRNILWDSTQTYLFSGCGVVAESELEAEWQELSDKRQSVKQLLGV